MLAFHCFTACSIATKRYQISSVSGLLYNVKGSNRQAAHQRIPKVEHLFGPPNRSALYRRHGDQHAFRNLVLFHQHVVRCLHPVDQSEQLHPRDGLTLGKFWPPKVPAILISHDMLPRLLPLPKARLALRQSDRNHGRFARGCRPSAARTCRFNTGGARPRRPLVRRVPRAIPPAPRW